MTAIQANIAFTLLDAAVPAERAKWLALWETWPQRDIVAHPGYVEMFAGSGDRTVCACQDARNGGIVFPLIVRSIEAEPWAGGMSDTCDLVSPYGYGGPFGWGVNSPNAFWAGFEEWVRSIHAVSLFARLSVFAEQLIAFPGERVVKGPSVIVRVTCDQQSLLKSYDKSARENIRQAERAGVTVEVDADCRRLDEFLNVYYATMKRLDALPLYFFSKAFFERLIRTLSQQMLLIHASHQQQVVSSEMLLLSQNYVYSFLAGTSAVGMSIRANPLLRHTVNVWAAMNGKQAVLLGGGYAGKDSLLHYKQRFAPTSQGEFAVGTRIFDPIAYQALVDRRLEWERPTASTWTPVPGFFPAYRA